MTQPPETLDRLMVPSRPWQHLGDMWQQGIDLLEYQTPDLTRERAALGERQGGRRRVMLFVLLAAAWNAVFTLVMGVLAGVGLFSVTMNAVGFLFAFLLVSGLAFLLAHALGGRASFRSFVYVTALALVPLMVLEVLLSMIASLIPGVGYWLMVLVSVLGVAAQVYVWNLSTQAIMNFTHPWQRRVMFAGLLLLVLAKGTTNILG